MRKYFIGSLHSGDHRTRAFGGIVAPCTDLHRRVRTTIAYTDLAQSRVGSLSCMLGNAVKQRLLLSVHLPLLLTTIFWGTNFVALRRLLHTLTVPDTIVVRGIVASLCYGLSLLALGR